MLHRSRLVNETATVESMRAPPSVLTQKQAPHKCVEASKWLESWISAISQKDKKFYLPNLGDKHLRLNETGDLRNSSSDPQRQLSLGLG